MFLSFGPASLTAPRFIFSLNHIFSSAWQKVHFRCEVDGEKFPIRRLEAGAERQSQPSLEGNRVFDDPGGANVPLSSQPCPTPGGARRSAHMCREY